MDDVISGTVMLTNDCVFSIGVSMHAAMVTYCHTIQNRHWVLLFLDGVVLDRYVDDVNQNHGDWDNRDPNRSVLRCFCSR